MLLTIEKMIYGGDGFARLPADENGRGKAAFVPFVLPCEEVEAEITLEKPGFVRAVAASISKPSPDRVTPSCPHFSHCGGCHYQHAGYETQLTIKRDILIEALRRTAHIELADEVIVHPSPAFGYRNRSRCQVRFQPEFAVGYYRANSHELLPVRECPISSPLINRGLTGLWQVGNAQAAPDLLEVEFFADSADAHMLADFICRDSNETPALDSFAAELRKAVPEIVGVGARVQPKPGKLAAEGRQNISGADHLLYETKPDRYRVSAGAFFQTNRFMIDELIGVVCAPAEAESILDLYAGVGLFSTVLARDDRHIVSVESSQPAAEDLAYNLPPKAKAVCATVEKFLAADRPKGRFRKGRPDLLIVDPPRSGMGEPVSRKLAALGAPQLTYVSCDPSTLARDLVPILAAGYRINEVHILDMFPQTYHLESVVKLSKK